MSALQLVKTVLVEHTHLAKDALHIYVALLLFFGACLLFRWRASQWKPWAVVLLAALAGEAWDIVDALDSADPIVPGAHIKDIWNTLLAPTAIVLLARFTRVFERQAKSGDEAQVPDPAARAESDVVDSGDR